MTLPSNPTTAPATGAATLLRASTCAPVQPPRQGHLRMGASQAPDGSTLEADSQCLLLRGRPWLPVMGEFHFSRSPAAVWADELAKMRAAGIDIVATYVFWNHHELSPGQLDWRDNRDLARFIALAAQAGLLVVVRLGPWAHGEARFGGVPDWIVDTMPTRCNDGHYLVQVQRLYRAIAQQLQGLLWKDGGPVIGVQLENEYNLRGPGRGEAHIAALKALALEAGLDVPMYTVTGWDGAVYPIDEVLPVFGGYPDEPWSHSTSELPPKETYAFRFGSRVSGDLGAQTLATAPGTAEQDIDRVPFFGAEYGAGLPQMYRRRTLVSADDIAAMLPVQLGSGVNLLGYYMFHGGRNPLPAGAPTLEESTATGGYNDCPRVSYDFCAPLGPDGQKRPVLDRMRPMHYFLNDFGEQLARMAVQRPQQVPADAADLQTARWSVRAAAGRGFVFFNNHVRQHRMPVQRAVQFALEGPDGELRFPSQPVDLADGSFFVWPFNLDLDGVLLRHATAQPVLRLDTGNFGIVYVFAQTEGVPVEISIGGQCSRWQPGLASMRQVGQANGRAVHLLVLGADEARKLTVVELQGQRRLVLSDGQAWVRNGRLRLNSVGEAHLALAVFPPLDGPRCCTAELRDVGRNGLFQCLEVLLPEHRPPLRCTVLRPAAPVPPVLRGGPAGGAVQPAPETFRCAAAWQLELPADALDGVDDVLLEIDFIGDIARLFAGHRLLDDWYFTGQSWQVSLRHVVGVGVTGLQLSVLPLRADAPIYIDQAHRPQAYEDGQVATLRGARLVPVYGVAIDC